MKTNTKFNLRILAVCLGLWLITVVFGLFLADSIDWHPSVWKTVYGIICYVILIVGAVFYGYRLNQLKAVALNKEKEAAEKATKKAKKTTKKTTE